MLKSLLKQYAEAGLIVNSYLISHTGRELYLLTPCNKDINTKEEYVDMREDFTHKTGLKVGLMYYRDAMNYMRFENEISNRFERRYIHVK